MEMDREREKECGPEENNDMWKKDKRARNESKCSSETRGCFYLQMNKLGIGGGGDGQLRTGGGG